MKKLSFAIAGAACVVLGGIGNAQASTIDTTSTWDGTTSFNLFGEPNTATYGQTFVVGSDNILNDFSFWLNDGTTPVKFAGYVMAWGGSKATGSVLYQSGQQSTTGAAGMEKFSFNTSGLSLTSGQKYVAFVNASNFFGGNGTATMGALPSNVYADGQYVYSNNGSNFGLLTTTAWDCNETATCSYGAGRDTAFTANFASVSAQAVPEPSSSLGLLAFGGFVAGKVLKRKKAQLTIELKDRE
jgi:PEP-CTERM motif